MLQAAGGGGLAVPSAWPTIRTLEWFEGSLTGDELVAAMQRAGDLSCRDTEAARS